MTEVDLPVDLSMIFDVLGDILAEVRVANGRCDDITCDECDYHDHGVHGAHRRDTQKGPDPEAKN